MRRTRRLLLLAIVLIVGGVWGTYYLQKTRQARQAPPPPETLPVNVNAEGKDWVYTQHDGRRPVVEVRARKMRQVAEPSQLELEQVELRIFDPDGKKYNQVRSTYASFDTDAGILYSDGEVEIALGIPADGSAPEQPVIIRSSGVRFDTTTGTASTERPASFTFGSGEGRSIGASYDPRWGDLRMHSEVVLNWRGEGPQGKLMTVEAGQLVYKEDHSKVYLSPWSRLTRETLSLEAGNSTVTLEDGAIRVVDAVDARGSDRYPARRIEYAANHLILNFTPEGEMEKIVGEGDAKLVSVSETTRTTVTSDQIFLDFELSEDGSYLKTALAMGDSALESWPRPRAGAPLAATRLMRAEVIKTIMRPGGEEVETIETHTPGTVEFLPNQPGQKHRRLDGERLWIHYGAGNRIRSFRAINVATRTDNEPSDGQDAPPPSLTWSKDLLADFDEQTAEIIRLEQWGDFRYQQGTQKATADRAVLDARRNLINLDGKARVWDETGSTAADRILLDQDTGDFTAAGHVSSTRLPEKQQFPGGMLAMDESLHATADRMVTTAGNASIVYEGKAVLWQGSNRLQADRIEIDRQQGMLRANGHVVSQFADKRETSTTVYTVVHALELTYSEQDRLAHYRKQVRLDRAGMRITAREVRVFFKETDGDQSPEKAGANLDYALADGEVKIVHKSEDRTRTGFADHAEYYVGEEKVVLSGGRPRMVDSLRGTTQGRQLTYFARNDRLLVEGAETQPAVSRLLRE